MTKKAKLKYERQQQKVDVKKTHAEISPVHLMANRSRPALQSFVSPYSFRQRHGRLKVTHTLKDIPSGQPRRAATIARIIAAMQL